jgi:hypothetical protein
MKGGKREERREKGVKRTVFTLLSSPFSLPVSTAKEQK